MKSLIFSAENVVKSIEGRKTQTRRIMKIQPLDGQGVWDFKDGTFARVGADYESHPFCAPLKVGDKFYAKERFGVEDGSFNVPDFSPFIFYADNAIKPITQAQFETFKRPNLAWHSPWFMPEFASRFVGEITAVRAERVKDISSDDTIAEGVGHPVHSPLVYGSVTEQWNIDRAFKPAWIALHGKESWERDWVWVYEYTKAE